LFLFVLGAGLAGPIGHQSSLGGAIHYQQFMFPGIVGMSIFITAMFAAFSVVWDREFGFMKEILISPAPRNAVFFGKIAGGATIGLIHGFIILLIAPLLDIYYPADRLLLLLVIMLLLSATSAALGLLIAGFQRSLEGYNSLSQLLVMPMIFFSGAFFPLSASPRWIELISLFNPIAYGVNLLRSILLQDVSQSISQSGSLPPVATSLLVLLGFLSLFSFIGLALFLKRE
jgi:ABC-2 type transport system permease protein